MNLCLEFSSFGADTIVCYQTCSTQLHMSGRKFATGNQFQLFFQEQNLFVKARVTSRVYIQCTWVLLESCVVWNINESNKGPAENSSRKFQERSHGIATKQYWNKIKWQQHQNNHAQARSILQNVRTSAWLLIDNVHSDHPFFPLKQKQFTCTIAKTNWAEHTTQESLTSSEDAASSTSARSTLL